MTPIYALDFDGVLCDSALETGMAGWQTAARLWPGFAKKPSDQQLSEFREIRPALETGYEAVLIMRLLQQRCSTAKILADYSGLLHEIQTDSGLDTADLKQAFAQTRDTWITQQPDAWLAMNPLFSGVANTLNQLTQQAPCFLVTTKQARFAQRILEGHQVSWPMERIHGLERGLAKADILKELQSIHPGTEIWFLEDRLDALLSVQDLPELCAIRLNLADWGYNTESDRVHARQRGISVISLSDFQHWPADHH